MVVVEEVVILYSNQLHNILQVLLVNLLRSNHQLIGLPIDRDQVEEVLTVKLVVQDKVMVLVVLVLTMVEVAVVVLMRTLQVEMVEMEHHGLNYQLLIDHR